MFKHTYEHISLMSGELLVYIDTPLLFLHIFKEDGPCSMIHCVCKLFRNYVVLYGNVL